MDIPYGSDTAHVFITNVGLITSDGPHGPNIMSSEWTHHVSYEPGLIAVCLGLKRATHENIDATKCFGVNIAANDQNVLCNLAGNHSGHSHDKIGALKELGFRFYKAETLDLLMVEGAVLNAECTLKEWKTQGDHTMYIGDVKQMTLHPEKTPLAYHRGKFWNLGQQLEKPSETEREGMKAVFERFKK